MLSFGEIFQKFLELEEGLKLFDRTIDGAPFWEYIRQPIIQTVFGRTASQSASYGKAPSFRERLKFLFVSFLRFWKNPIFARRMDVMFISSPRRVLMKDGYWWDIITDYILEDIDLSYVAIEHNLNLEHRNPPKTSNLWYFDFQNSLIYIAEKLGLFQVSVERSERYLLKKIQDEIAQSFNINIDVEKLTRMHLGYRKIRIAYFSFVLKRIRPKALILMTSYGKEDLIEAARLLRIPVIELQHGVTTRYHPGYSFPEKKHVKSTFPDWLFTFGDYWSTCTSYPIDSKHVISTGFPHMDEERKAFSDLRKKKQILIISQWTIGEELSKFAAELSKVENLGYKIIYKLHPAESMGWHEKYPWLVDCDVDVIHDSKISIYQLFAESEVQIGVYSTAIFEGLVFGLQTYIPEMHGFEYTEQLVEEGVAVRVANVEELVNHLKSEESFAKFDTERFFRSDAKERIIDTLKEIISQKDK